MISIRSSESMVYLCWASIWTMLVRSQVWFTEKTWKYFLIKQMFIEPHCPWMNRAKGEIGWTKTHYWWVMNHHQCLEVFWCFGMEYTSGLQQRIARSRLGDHLPLEKLTRETPDILEYTDYNFYEFVIYYNLLNDSGEDGKAHVSLDIG